MALATLAPFAPFGEKAGDEGFSAMNESPEGVATHEHEHEHATNPNLMQCKRPRDCEAFCVLLLVRDSVRASIS